MEVHGRNDFWLKNIAPHLSLRRGKRPLPSPHIHLAVSELSACLTSAKADVVTASQLVLQQMVLVQAKSLCIPGHTFLLFWSEKSYAGKGKCCQLHCQLVLLLRMQQTASGRAKYLSSVTEEALEVSACLKFNIHKVALMHFARGSWGWLGLDAIELFHTKQHSQAAARAALSLCNAGALQPSTRAPAGPNDLQALASTTPAAENLCSTLGSVHS